MCRQIVLCICVWSVQSIHSITIVFIFQFIQEYRSFDFRPDISAGHQYDPIIVPNVPFLTAAWEIERADFVKELAVKAVLMATQSKPFVVSFLNLFFFFFFHL